MRIREKLGLVAIAKREKKKHVKRDMSLDPVEPPLPHEVPVPLKWFNWLFYVDDPGRVPDEPGEFDR